MPSPPEPRRYRYPRRSILGRFYTYLGRSRWSASHGHLREVTADDIRAGLEELRGHSLCTAISAVRSLFRFAKKRGLVFADPAQRLSAAEPEPSMLPMTDDEIRAVEQAITLPGQRLIVALAAVHAARWKAIQALALDDLDLPNRRITITGHLQRLGDLSHQALRGWLDYRRATWPHSPNRHVLISKRTALGDQPVTRGYVNFHLGPHGVSIERIRRDRILHEALTGRPDPLHITLMFGISDRPASQYARIARDLLAEGPVPEDRRLAPRVIPRYTGGCGQDEGTAYGFPRLASGPSRADSGLTRRRRHAPRAAAGTVAQRQFAVQMSRREYFWFLISF